MNTVVNTRFLAVGIVAVILVLGFVASMLFERSDDSEISLSLSDAIGGTYQAEEAATGISYKRATGPIPFVFPGDHGPHNRFKLEWWYFTGNLEGADGQQFGYQLTFFRTALRPSAVPEKQDSSWSTSQLYSAHFTVTDVNGNEFYVAEKLARGAAGLAGATADPFRVWVDDWSLSQVGAETFPLRLRAETDKVAINLQVTPSKPMVLQGDNGFSRKGRDDLQASYYYSYSRLATEGSITINDNPTQVSGSSWLDREWSTSLLGRTQEGWDWFSLQLDDETDLMVFELREKDGISEPYRDGALVDAAGRKQQLDPDQIQLEVLSTWRNRDDTATYPSKWRLRVPEASIDVEIVPLVADQELRVSIRYWEGAVRVKGTRMGKPVDGLGYVELTGYRR